MAKYRNETHAAAGRVFSALIVAAYTAKKDGSKVRADKLQAMATDLEMEFELTHEEAEPK